LRRAAPGLDADCKDLRIDNCFDGWDGLAYLNDDLLHSRIEANLQHLVVYTHADLDVVAIEPVSHVNNALHLSSHSATQLRGVDQADPLGLRVAQPGESFGVQMTISAQHA
jgi:aldose 1-epimerase